MKYLAIVMTFLLLVACDKPSEGQTAVPVATEAPAGHYTLDKSHTSLIFHVNHLGFSTYTGAFTTYDATLEFDPANPSAMKFDGTVDVASLTLSNPPAGFVADLLGAAWFEAEKFPTISFRSTAVEVTGANSANVTGDFTLHGVKKPLILAVTFNGGYAGHPYDPNARVGFSATGTIKRSDYGIAYGVPEPGTTMGVGDDVQLILEAEFTGPPLQGAAAEPGAH